MNRSAISPIWRNRKWKTLSGICSNPPTPVAALIVSRPGRRKKSLSTNLETAAE
jgi:hypothetical protein